MHIKSIILYSIQSAHDICLCKHNYIFLHYTMESGNKCQAYLPSAGHPIVVCLEELHYHCKS